MKSTSQKVAGTFHVPSAASHGTWNVPATLVSSILPIALQQAEGSCTQHVLFFLLIVFLLIIIVLPGFGEHKCCPDGRWHR